MVAGPPTPGPPPLDPDAADLASFGYRERLDRTLGGFSSFAAGFSYLSILTGLPQLFYLGFGAGGPAFFWTWPAVLLGQMAVACCFAELAAEIPLSGGAYQWARRLGWGASGWLAGWVALGCAVISMASVALALQGVLRQLAPGLPWADAATDPGGVARVAVGLGCGAIAISTLINLAGVRLMALVNNVGVAAELVGATLLAVALFWAARRGPAVVLDTQGLGGGESLGYLGPFLTAALTPSFVMYGFDSAGSLAEETVNPRRIAPWAILGALGAAGAMGACLILGALMAAPDLVDPRLGQLGGGMPLIIRGAIRPALGRLLLADVALAILVCTLTVHALAVRLIFAMARDNTLPWSGRLAAIGGTGRSPRLPVVLVGLAAAALLACNADSPAVVETLASVAIVWANLGYLFVTVPQLARRRSAGGPAGAAPSSAGRGGGRDKLFHLGRWGFPINVVAVCWSVALIVNVGWPRAAIYGEPWHQRFVAAWATLALVGSGWLYHGWALRHGGSAVLAEHRAPRPDGAEGRAVGETEEPLR